MLALPRGFEPLTYGFEGRCWSSSASEALSWRSREDSNLDLSLRRAVFYPVILRKHVTNIGAVSEQPDVIVPVPTLRGPYLGKRGRPVAEGGGRYRCIP